MTVTPVDRSASSSPLHILISTGEVSGDLQGGYLVEALHRQAKARAVPLKLTAIGGQRMATAGADLLEDTTTIGSVGIFEALPYLLPVLRMQRRIHRFLRRSPTDLVIFLDYMGPNLNLGQYLLKHFPNLPTAYYIAPQQWVWAFSDKDTRALVNISDQMVAVFPQEAEYYRRYGAEVNYFGHPLVDKLTDAPSQVEARQNLGISADAQVVTLLPASRRQEVKYVLPLILSAAEKIQAAQPAVEFLIPISTQKLESAISEAIAASPLRARIIHEKRLEAIAAADLVINKSGTVNLEVGLLNVPQIVVYRLNPLTARIAYYLLKFKVDFISPVNLLVSKAVVPEFIQWEATTEGIAESALKLLNDADACAQMQTGYADLRDKMGQPGVCDRVANHLLDFALQHKAETH
jgi:lipid-A-disaccharide synthase